MSLYISCEQCGRDFIPARSTARFCTPKCRVYWNRASKQLPNELVSRDRWMRWKLQQRNGKTTKVPKMATGGNASSTDSSTWVSFEEARRSTVGDGVGFALGDGIGCIDLDDSIIDGTVAGWAREILDHIPATFVEVSQSGKGLHIFGYLPERGGRVIRDGRSIEVYSSGRFIAVTGDRFERFPARLADLTAVVDRL